MQFNAETLAKEIVGGVAAAKAGPGKATITAMAVKPSDFCAVSGRKQSRSRAPARRRAPSCKA